MSHAWRQAPLRLHLRRGIRWMLCALSAAQSHARARGGSLSYRICSGVLSAAHGAARSAGAGAGPELVGRALRGDLERALVHALCVVDVHCGACDGRAKVASFLRGLLVLRDIRHHDCFLAPRSHQ
eukprot:Amastigsp_a176446_146.p4 type:complete len:126 gc:universal Amastigsp_a176446_146:394-17(-)